jgi:hypothetical protein
VLPNGRELHNIWSARPVEVVYFPSGTDQPDIEQGRVGVAN